jgi:hypothetical protein
MALYSKRSGRAQGYCDGEEPRSAAPRRYQLRELHHCDHLLTSRAMRRSHSKIGLAPGSGVSHFWGFRGGAAAALVTVPCTPWSGVDGWAVLLYRFTNIIE